MTYSENFENLGMSIVFFIKKLTMKNWAVLFLIPLVEKYVFADFHYLEFLFVSIVLNTLFGMGLAWRERRFDPSKLVKGIVTKIFMYGGCLNVIHILTNVPINGKKVDWLIWVGAPLLYTFVAKEGAGTFLTIEKIRPGTIPKWIIDRLEKFNQTGNVLDLKQTPQT